jgi:CRP-like cAMP-binding protein
MDLSIQQQLLNTLQIPANRLQELLQCCTVIKHAKNDLISTNERKFSRLGYIINGAARVFYVNDDGEEISYLLQVNGDVIGDYASFITGQPSQVQIEILLDTEVLYLEKSNIDKLIEQDLFWLRFAKHLSDLAFLSAKQRLDELFFYTPEQRYINLLKKSPEIWHKIPQKHISSYLGITPQSLSRIRKRISASH